MVTGKKKGGGEEGGVKSRRGENFKQHLNNWISSPSSDCFTNAACQLQLIECKVQISRSPVE